MELLEEAKALIATKEFNVSYHVGDGENVNPQKVMQGLVDRIEAMGWKSMDSCPRNEHVLILTKESFMDGGKLTRITIEQWDGNALQLEFIIGYKAIGWLPLPPIGDK